MVEQDEGSCTGGSVKVSTCVYRFSVRWFRWLRLIAYTIGFQRGWSRGQIFRDCSDVSRRLRQLFLIVPRRFEERCKKTISREYALVVISIGQCFFSFLLLFSIPVAFENSCRLLLLDRSQNTPSLKEELRYLKRGFNQQLVEANPLFNKPYLIYVHESSR